MSREIMQQALDVIKNNISMWKDLHSEQERNVIAALEAELLKPEQEVPEPLMKIIREKFTSGNSIEVERITITRAEYEAAKLAKPEQDHGFDRTASHMAGEYVAAKSPRKPWVGLTSEDWENLPDTGKQGCERDAEIFDWIEVKLKEKNA